MGDNYSTVVPTMSTFAGAQKRRSEGVREISHSRRPGRRGDPTAAGLWTTRGTDLCTERPVVHSRDRGWTAGHTGPVTVTIRTIAPDELERWTAAKHLTFGQSRPTAETLAYDR